MTLEAAIQENTAALRELIGILANSTPAPAKAAKKKEPEAPQQPEPRPAPTAAPSAAVTYDDAKRAILKLSAEKGRDAAVAILGKHGAAKLQDVKPEHYADVLREATEALA